MKQTDFMMTTRTAMAVDDVKATEERFLLSRSASYK